MRRLCIFLLGVGIIGCSSALPQTSLPAPTLENIGDLPSSTDPVAESSNSSLSAAFKAATTGAALGQETDEDDFAGKSYG